jgi:hypothetical protein
MCRLLLLEVSLKFIPPDTLLPVHLANLVQSVFSGAVGEAAGAIFIN